MAAVVAEPAAPPPILAISGMAGVGKTTLAVHLAHRLAERYPDAQLYIDLHGHAEREPDDAGAAVSVLLRQLGVAPHRVPEAVEDRMALWRAELVNRRVLVLLDNAAGSRQVVPLLPGMSDTLVIVTSRRVLAGLDGVRAASLGVLPAADAADLLGRLIGARATAAPPARAARSKQVEEACMKLSAARASKAGRRLALAVLAAAVATTVSAPAAIAAPAQPLMDPPCAGTFSSWWSPATITIRRSPAPVGRIDWNFLLTPTAQFVFGPTVTVWIDRAYVNGREITSPYSPHTEPSNYDFHGSLNSYNWRGSAGGGTIQTGDQLALYWTLESDSAVGQAALACTVPAPGVG